MNDPRITLSSSGNSFFRWLLFLFLLAPLIFTFTNVNISNLLYAVGATVLIFYWLLVDTSINRTVFFYLIFYLSWLIVYGTLYSKFNGISLSVSSKQLIYYLKPVFFFLIGYMFLNQSRFEKLIRFTFLFTIVGAIAFLVNTGFFIQKAIEKNPEGQGMAHFLALGGQYIRNCSFYLSPLDTGFICFFLSAYFLTTGKKKHCIAILMVLVLTITRSAIIAFIVAFLTRQLVKATTVKKITYIALYSTLALLILVLFYKEITFLLISDGSASIHITNIIEVSKEFWQRPLGHGIGYSGWSSIGEQNHLYSEGSLQTSLLENGALFSLFYVVMGVYIYRVDRYVMFPIFAGFVVASLLIPIGFSTLFNLLFFTCLGMRARKFTTQQNEKIGDLANYEKQPLT